MSFSLDLQDFSISGNHLRYAVVPWDSEIFGFKVVEITDVDVTDHRKINAFLRSFEAEMKKLGGRMACVKIPLEKPEILKGFQNSDYAFIEETIKPYIRDLQNARIDYPSFVKYPILKADGMRLPEIQDIARETFKNDRFHLDKGFSHERASERYATWVKNSLDGGEEVLYLDVNGKAAGFSIVSTGPKSYLGLIGLADPFKGKGLGMNLFAGTCQHVKACGCREFSTTMSLNNVAALNQYVACGFKFRDPVYVLHKWM